MFGMSIKEIDAQTLAQWRSSGEPLRLIDVRTPPEISRGVIAGAEAIPMHLIPLNPPRPQADEKVVIYCRSGARSAQVCAYLEQMGIHGTYNLQGGIISWVSAGQSLVEPGAAIISG
jgi:rhodanese-related sulfurtransferase